MKRWMLAFCLVFASGCGYTTGSLLPANYRTISIQPFKNNINFVAETSRALYVPLLETKVRAAITDRFLFDGHLKVAKTEVADLVLSGELLAFEREELRTTDNLDVQEYRIRITISLNMLDTAAGVPFFSEPVFSGEATYFTVGPQAKSESAAIEDALTDLARRVVERTIENW